MRRMRLGIVGAATALVAAAALAAPALADEWANPDGDGGIDYGIETDPSDSYTGPTDDYDGYDGYSPDDVGGGSDPLTPPEQLDNDYDNIYCYIPEMCPDAPPVDEGTPEQEAPPPVNPAELGQAVLDHMEVPSPHISIAPAPPRPTLVQLWTWFWIPDDQWQPHSDSVSLNGTTVTVTIEPESVDWQTGEGTTTCDGPGEPWSPGSDAETSSCGHEYEHTTVDQPGGKYTVSATMSWHASWHCEGICTGYDGDLGEITPGSTSAQLEVRQRQSLVIE